MYTRIGVCTALFVVVAILLSLPLSAEAPLRGLVVDKGDDVLWLGFPEAVQKGMAFDVMLVPGSEVVARAEVLEATPDAPYVAKANFKMLDKKAYIPVGAYVEAAKLTAADRDRDTMPGYKGMNLGPKDNPLSLQAGVFFPSNDQLQDETDEVWPALQLDYRISRSEAAELSIGVGYYGRHGTFVEGIESGGRVIRVIPITIDAKLKFSEQCASGGWYGKVGAGAYIVIDERTVGAVSEDNRTTTIGWQAAIGHESRSGRTVQLGYVDARQSDFKGVSFTLGARF